MWTSAAEWHGAMAPCVRRYQHLERTAVQDTFLKACEQGRNTPESKDHNAPGALGAGPLPVNTLDGMRQSTSLVYLAPVRARPNLENPTGGMADRVLLEDGRAIGDRLADGTDIGRATWCWRRAPTAALRSSCARASVLPMT